MLERRLRAYELALDSARRDAVQSAQTLAKLSARIAELALELSQARQQPATLEARLAEQQRETRVAEQRAHAEQVFREELQSELAALERQLDREADVLEPPETGGTPDDPELEAELTRLRRLADESEQVVAASRTARERAEGRVVELTAQVEQLAAERAQLSNVLSELRRELGTLRALVEQELDNRRTPPAAVPELAPELRASTSGGGQIEPERFEAALARLREVSQTPVDAPILATTPWIRGTLSRIADRDPETAGALVLQLLVAQRAVHPGAIAYDIDLSGLPCLQVTIDESGQRLVSAAKRRSPDQVRFAITGDLSSFARLMVAGRLRRRFSRRVAHVEGDRSGLGALDALLRASLTLPQLRAFGFQIEPVVALSLAAAMIRPAWTSGSRFTVAFADRATPPDQGQELPALVVEDGARVTVSSVTSPGTTVSCDPDDLLALLAGDAVSQFDCRGPREPLLRLQLWLNRAQSG